MLYRANLGIHSQLPPESISVSLSIMHIDLARAWSDQYGFVVESNAVTGVLSPTSTECCLRCAVGMGGDEALDFTNEPDANIRAVGSGWRASRRAAV